MKLSILIPTLHRRIHFLNRLLEILRPQLNSDVEVVVEVDDGTMSIGEKRNALIGRAKGDYICFIDDDDRVSNDYISELFVGINKDVDVVSIKGELTTNGSDPHRFVDRPYSKWTRLNDGTYIRGVQHLDAIRRNIASRFKFEHKNFSEDQDWSQKIEASQLVRSYHQVTKLVYFYDYRADKQLSYSIIIPSANATNLITCINGIRNCERGLLPNKIIVVDDGARNWSEGSLPRVTWVDGVKPFVYARNCNLGIKEADPNDDIILLNDDAILKTMGGFSSMVKASEGYGVVSAVTNFIGNIDQTFQGTSEQIRPEGNALYFVCVCIPRQTINKIGLLDERFVAYGHDDSDYCFRVRIAGLKLGIYDGCFVDHLSTKHTFKRDITEGKRIFDEKWGFLGAV